MKTLHSKLPCAALFANFFLVAASVLPLLYSGAAAQTIVSARRTELPDATGSTQTAEHSFSCNPALFITVDSAVAGAVVTPSRFGMPELACADLLVAVSDGTTAYAGTVTGTGTTLYNELSVAGFFALAPSDEFAAGAGAMLTRLGFRDAGSETALHLHLGALLHLTPDISAGAALHNITRAQFGGGEHADQRALLSLGFRLTPGLAASTGVNVHIGRASSAMLAVSYTAMSAVRLRIGVQTAPRSIEGGIAWTFDSFTITGTAQYHDPLGFSQSVGCLYRW